MAKKLEEHDTKVKDWAIKEKYGKTAEQKA